VGQGDSGGQHQAGVSPIRSQAALRVIENGIADLSDVNAKEVRVMGSKAYCCARSWLLQAQKRRLLAFAVLYRSGAPRPMKMGNIRSLFRYDAAARHAQDPSNRRPRAI
jgi:hypothetical protein